MPTYARPLSNNLQTSEVNGQADRVVQSLA